MQVRRADLLEVIRALTERNARVQYLQPESHDDEESEHFETERLVETQALIQRLSALWDLPKQL